MSSSMVNTALAQRQWFGDEYGRDDFAGADGTPHKAPFTPYVLAVRVVQYWNDQVAASVSRIAKALASGGNALAVLNHLANRNPAEIADELIAARAELVLVIANTDSFADDGTFYPLWQEVSWKFWEKVAGVALLLDVLEAQPTLWDYIRKDAELALELGLDVAKEAGAALVEHVLAPGARALGLDKLAKVAAVVAAAFVLVKLS